MHERQNFHYYISIFPKILWRFYFMIGVWIIWWWLARSIFLSFCKLCGGAVAWWRSDSLGHWVCWQAPDTTAVQFCVCRQTLPSPGTAMTVGPLPPSYTVPACSIQNMFAVPAIYPCSTNSGLSVIVDSKNGLKSHNIIEFQLLTP